MNKTASNASSDGKLVHFTGVCLRRKEMQVLSDVDFSLDAGEFVYLIGKVGSGKSSLLKSMYAELPITSGQARVFDYDLTSIRRSEIPYLRRRMGIVFQDFQLLNDRDVHDNLSFVLGATGWHDRHDIEQRIRQVLTEVGMQGKGYKMPHELSGGEQQRIVIARALLNRPRLILADEPTGNLDPATGELIVEHLRQIASQGTAVLMATHNLQLVDRYPGRIIHCRNRRLEE